MKRTLLTSALVGTMLLGSSANAAVLKLTDWGFDANNGFGLIAPIDEMTFLGMSYIDADMSVVGAANTLDAGDTFTDAGRLEAENFQDNNNIITTSRLNLDPSIAPGGYKITAEFLDWTGTYTSVVGAIAEYAFDPGGTLNMYIDTSFNEGTLDPFDGQIEKFGDDPLDPNDLPLLQATIVRGDGVIDLANTNDLDGTVDIEFMVTQATAGYFFKWDAGTATWIDLATLACDPVVDPLCDPIYFALADSNNAILDHTTIGSDGFGGVWDQLDEIQEVSAHGPYGPIEYDVFGNQVDLLTTNNGSYAPAIAEQVSEPGMLSLMGLAFLGLAGLRRRRED